MSEMSTVHSGHCSALWWIFFCKKKQTTSKEILQHKAQLSRIKTTDLRLLRSIATTWVAFFIMWTPFGIVAIFDTGHWSSSFFAISVLLAHTNSSVNCIKDMYNSYGEYFLAFCVRTQRAVNHQWLP